MGEINFSPLFEPNPFTDPLIDMLKEGNKPYSAELYQKLCNAIARFMWVNALPFDVDQPIFQSIFRRTVKSYPWFGDHELTTLKIFSIIQDYHQRLHGNFVKHIRRVTEPRLDHFIRIYIHCLYLIGGKVVLSFVADVDRDGKYVVYMGSLTVFYEEVTYNIFEEQMLCLLEEYVKVENISCLAGNAFACNELVKLFCIRHKIVRYCYVELSKAVNYIILENISSTTLSIYRGRVQTQLRKVYLFGVWNLAIRYPETWGRFYNVEESLLISIGDKTMTTK